MEVKSTEAMKRARIPLGKEQKGLLYLVKIIAGERETEMSVGRRRGAGRP